MDETSTSRAQEEIYDLDAEGYDELVSAEDADGNLLPAFSSLATFAGARVVDVGAGTGRLTRVVGRDAAHVDLVDRAAAMIDRARRGLADRQNVAFHVADARRLPLPDGSYDVAMAGWVFGHFRHWMPVGWQGEVAAALAEMRRVLRPGGVLVVVETLGTGHTVPRRHEALDEYFAFLEAEGLVRSWIRTDYAFSDLETAARVTGKFFGAAFAERVRAEGWTRVPECTGIFRGVKGLGGWANGWGPPIGRS